MITMINPIVVTGDLDRFEKVLDRIQEHMSRQPGFLGLRLHRSTRRSAAYCMVAQWTDMDAHQRAADTMPDDITALFSELRTLTDGAPDFYQTVATRGTYS